MKYETRNTKYELKPGIPPRRYIVFRILYFVFIATSFRAVALASPRIQFDNPIYHFGVLIQGASTQHTFAFKNAGKSPLEIESVQTSCGCTAALPDERVIDPGKWSQIRVTFDSRGKMGETHKVIRVKTNDPEEPVTHLTVQGLVVPSQHPEMTGPQNLFGGSCKTCHVDQGVGKFGESLYKADCAMCHEHHKMGGPMIAASAEDMSRLSSGALKSVIAGGRPGTSMPAFHKSRGGPLSDKEISSLVKYIKGAKNKKKRGE